VQHFGVGTFQRILYARPTSNLIRPEQPGNSVVFLALPYNPARWLHQPLVTSV
jgi:hypothetical protein